MEASPCEHQKIGMLTSSEGQGVGDCLYQAWLTPERWREGGEKGGSEGEREKGEREREGRKRERRERENDHHS